MRIIPFLSHISLPLSERITPRKVWRFIRRIARVGLHFLSFARSGSRNGLFRLLYRLRNAIGFDLPLRLSIDDISFLLHPQGSIAEEVWMGSLQEEKAILFMLRIIQPQTIFIDVGANVGLYALAAAQKIHSENIYALEPCEGTFCVLRKNIRLNQIPNIKAFPIALGDYSGEAQLYINSRNKEGLNTLGKPSHPCCRIVGKETVPIMTLDEFVEGQGISRVDVMKVDVEGAELQVFRGGRNLLQREDAPLILYESASVCTKGFDYHPVEIMWLLDEWGYRFFEINDKNDQLIPTLSPHVYKDILVAVKPSHPLFPRLRRSNA